MCVVEEDVYENYAAVGGENTEVSLGNGMDSQTQDFCALV